MEALLKLPQVRLSQLETKILKGKYYCNHQTDVFKNKRNFSCSGFDVRSPYYYHTRQNQYICHCKGPKCLCCWMNPNKKYHPKFAYLNKKQSANLTKITTQPNEIQNIIGFPKLNEFEEKTKLKKGKKRKNKMKQLQQSPRILQLQQYVRKQFQNLNRDIKEKFEQKYKIKCDQEIRQKLVEYVSQQLPQKQELVKKSHKNKQIQLQKIFNIEDELLGQKFAKSLCINLQQITSGSNSSICSYRKFKQNNRSHMKASNSVFKPNSIMKKKDRQSILLFNSMQPQMTNNEGFQLLINYHFDGQGNQQQGLNGFLEKFANLNFQEYREKLQQIWKKINIPENNINNNIDKFQQFIQLLEKKLITTNLKDKKIVKFQQKIEQLQRIQKEINMKKSQKYLKSTKKLGQKSMKSTKNLKKDISLCVRKEQNSKQCRKRQNFGKKFENMNEKKQEQRNLKVKNQDQIGFLNTGKSKKKSGRISRLSGISNGDTDNLDENDDDGIQQDDQLVQQDKDMVLNLLGIAEMKKNKLPSTRMSKILSDRSRSSKASSLDRNSFAHDRESLNLQQNEDKSNKVDKENKVPPLKDVKKKQVKILKGVERLKQCNMQELIIKPTDSLLNRKRKIRNLRQCINLKSKNIQQNQNFDQIMHYILLFEEQLYESLNKRKKLTVHDEKIGHQKDRLEMKNLISMKELRGDLKFMDLNKNYVFGEADQMDTYYEQKKSEEYHAMMEERKRRKINIDRLAQQKMQQVYKPFQLIKRQTDLIQKPLLENGILEIIMPKDQRKIDDELGKNKDIKGDLPIADRVRQLLAKKKGKVKQFDKKTRLLLTQFSTLSISEQNSGFSKEVSFN